MIRIRFLHAAIAIGTLSMPLLACGGRVVSIGSNADQLQSVNPSTISSSIASCPSGFAHPNICCSGGPSQASSCGAYMTSPFHPCDSGSTTYPNPLSCCSLTDGSCVDSGSVATPPPPPQGTCTSVCPPGYWTATGSNDTLGASPAKGGTQTGGSPGPSTYVTCCRTLPDGSTECAGEASTGVDQSPPNSTGCGSEPPQPPTPVDAGIGVDDGSSGTDPSNGTDAGCATTDASAISTPSSPPSGTCDIPCPPGWTVQPGAADVCCRDNGDGTGECFSQSSGGWGSSGSSGNSSGPGTPPVPDPGTGPSSGRDCYGSVPSSDGGPPPTCGCQSVSNGQKETLDCDDATLICTCGNGTTTWTEPYDARGHVCANPTTLDGYWTACGFAL